MFFYFPNGRRKARLSIKKSQDEKRSEKTDELKPIKTKLIPGYNINVEIVSTDIQFSDCVSLFLDSSFHEVRFISRPLDNCRTGISKHILRISDKSTNNIILEREFSLKIVDYIFDSIPRSTLSKLVFVLTSLGSVSMFLLTFFEQIDETFGLTAGTAVGAFALFMFSQHFYLYKASSSRELN